MFNQWSDIVKEGGISAPAWGFFTLIATGVGWLIRNGWTTKRVIRKAAVNAERAVSNTTNVSNGFVQRQDENFASLFALVNRIDGRVSTMDNRFDKLEEKLDSHITENEKPK